MNAIDARAACNGDDPASKLAENVRNNLARLNDHLHCSNAHVSGVENSACG